MAKAQNQKGKMDMQKMMQIYQKVGTPGAPHKRLEMMTGSWITKVTGWMDPESPPMESKGTCKQKMILNGRFLQQEYAGDMMGTMFKGINLIGYNNFTKEYESIWIDSMSTAIYFFKGPASRDGKTITQKSRYNDPARGPLTWRSVTRIIDENTMRYEMYVAAKRGKENKEMEMILTRKK
jgi:hypothetical protein